MLDNSIRKPCSYFALATSYYATSCGHSWLSLVRTTKVLDGATSYETVSTSAMTTGNIGPLLGSDGPL